MRLGLDLAMPESSHYTAEAIKPSLSASGQPSLCKICNVTLNPKNNYLKFINEVNIFQIRHLTFHNAELLCQYDIY